MRHCGLRHRVAGRAPILGFAVLVVFGLGASSLARGEEASDLPGGEPTVFTGDIKPVLYVSDIEASAEFFRDVLGFAFLGYANDSSGEPYYAEMAAGRQKFGLHLPITDKDGERVGKQRLYFRVTDLVGQRKRVEAAGGEPGAIKETAWMNLFVVEDPDGHEIVFAVTEAGTHSTDPWKLEPND